MISSRRGRAGQFQPVWWGIAIFTFTLVVFMVSRVHQVTDSSYSMMLSQSLLDHGSFALDHYTLPPAYQLETINGHTYYRFPPGTSVLSAPVVWVLNRFGISAANADGTYNPRGEVMIEAGLAAFLMALLAGIFFYTARLLLPDRWSAVVALGGSLGTQVYSTAGFVFYLLVRFRKFPDHTRLVWMSLAIIGVHLIAISGLPHWWAGHSFGPRFSTGLVPWLVLLSILAIRAMLNWREQQHERLTHSFAWRAQLFCGGLLLFVSVFINTLGATSHATWLWNVRPRGVDEHPERLWDWRQPQFLAGILPFPEPTTVHPIGFTRIDFTQPEADKYFWYGWNEGPPDARWTESKAAMVFTLGNDRPEVFQLNLTPYLVAGKLTSQRVTVSLNGKQLKTFVLDSPAAQTHTIPISPELLRTKNVLSFELPDAESPQKLGTEPDPRPRGMKVNWIEFGV